MYDPAAVSGHRGDRPVGHANVVEHLVDGHVANVEHLVDTSSLGLGYEAYKKSPTGTKTKCENKADQTEIFGVECFDYTEDVRFKLGAAFAGIGFCSIVLLCWCPGDHTHTSGSNTMHLMILLAVKFVTFVPTLYYTFHHETLDAQGAVLSTNFSLIILIGYYGACMRHALALHVTSGLCTFAILMIGWTMFSSGFGEQAKPASLRRLVDSDDLKFKPTTGILVAGSFAIVFCFVGSVMHGLHGHRIHTEEGGMCGRKQKYTQNTQGQPERSTELAVASPPALPGV